MGISNNDACAACHAAVGDLPHRILECPRSEDIRAGWDDKGYLTRAIDKRNGPLYLRGVAVRPPIPPPPELRMAYDHAEGEEDTPFHSYVFLDGAMRHNATPLARRGGWAAVMTDRHGNMRRVLYGTSPDPFPTIFLAELRAAVMALKETIGSAILFSDNAQVVSEWQRGQIYCTDGKRQGADLWRQFWHSVNELDGAVRIVKVKAHLTARDVEAGRIPEAIWKGNGHADHYAKKGAAWAEELSPVKHILEAMDEAKWFYSAASQIMSRWPNDVETTDQKERHQVKERRKRKGRSAHHKTPHELWRIGGRMVCRRCGRTAKGLLPVRVLKASPCHGSSAGRLAETAGQLGGRIAKDLSLYTEEDFVSRGGTRVETLTLQVPAPARDTVVDVHQPPPLAAESAGPAGEDAAHDAGAGSEERVHADSPHQTADLSQHPADGPRDQTSQHVNVRKRIRVKTRPPGGVHLAALGGGPAPARDRQDSPTTRRVRRRVTGERSQLPLPDAAAPEQVVGAPQGLAEGGGLSEVISRDPLDEAEQQGDMDEEAFEQQMHTDTPLAVLHPDPSQASGSASGGALGASTCPAPPLDPTSVQLPSERPKKRARPALGRGHRLSAIGGLIWCRTCGHYSERRTYGLSADCRGEATGVYVSRRRRLQEGKHPISEQPLV